MIIESLITDDSKIAFDSCKATIHRGQIIDVPDEYFHNPEIQGAIRLGLIKVVGEPPSIPAPSATAAVADKKIKLRSRAPNRMAFECIKDAVSPGEFLWVPEGKMTNIEIQNAIDMGFLEDPDAPKATVHRTNPVVIEEVDIVEPAAGQPAVEAIPARRRNRPAAQTNSPIKAKRIASSGSESEDAESDSSDGLYSESRIIEPKAQSPFKPAREQAAPKAPKKSETVEDSFSFLDVFGK